MSCCNVAVGKEKEDNDDGEEVEAATDERKATGLIFPNTSVVK